RQDIRFRQAAVEDDHVGAGAVRPLEGVAPVKRFENRVPAGAQDAFERTRDPLLRVGQEHQRGAGGSRCIRHSNLELAVRPGFAKSGVVPTRRSAATCISVQDSCAGGAAGNSLTEAWLTGYLGDPLCRRRSVPPTSCNGPAAIDTYVARGPAPKPRPQT